MAKRRRYFKSAAHYRANPLQTSEIVVGCLVGAAALGVGGYFLYQYLNPPAGAAQLAAANAAAGQAPLPGGTGAPTASQVSPSQLSTTPSTAA
jgi:hypothetical protein